MSAPTILIIAVVATACAVACPRAVAADEDNLPSSVKRVERETGGRVLSAERRNQSGREVNRIKVYTPEGRVRVMWDEPRRNAAQPVPRNAAQPAPRGEPQPEARIPRGRDGRPPSPRDDRSRDDRY